MLTTDTLRTTLAAACEWLETRVGEYLGALQDCGLLPRRSALLDVRDVVLVALALLSGRTGTWSVGLPIEPRLFQLRRVRSPDSDLVLLDNFYRDGADSVLSGLYFEPLPAAHLAV